MGALLRGVKRDEVRRGQVLIAPGSMKAVKGFLAQIYVSCGTSLYSFDILSGNRF